MHEYFPGSLSLRIIEEFEGQVSCFIEGCERPDHDCEALVMRYPATSTLGYRVQRRKSARWWLNWAGVGHDRCNVSNAVTRLDVEIEADFSCAVRTFHRISAWMSLKKERKIRHSLKLSPRLRVGAKASLSSIFGPLCH
jgi:hypothetical protein